MKIDILDTKGKVLEQLELAKEIFGVTPNEDLVAQYVRVYNNNQRQGTSSTKTRGDVSGGGKKPWRQKGTGRARVGSSRNPIWRHGGVSHGPQPRSWARKMTKKMRQGALASVLSSKMNSKAISVISELKLKEPNTKNFEKIMQDTKTISRRTLFVLDNNDMTIRRSVSNIKNASTALVSNLNAYEALLAHKIVFIKSSLDVLNEKYGVTAKASKEFKKAVKEEE